MAARSSDVDAFEARAAARLAELGDDIDHTTFAAMFDLFRVFTRLQTDLEANVHRPAGLSTAGFRVLFTTWVFGVLEPREIARLSGVSTAAVSGVLKTLERDGHVDRETHPSDARRQLVRATESGADLVAEVYRRQNERERELFGGVDGEELARFTQTLRRLLRSR